MRALFKYLSYKMADPVGSTFCKTMKLGPDKGMCTIDTMVFTVVHDDNSPASRGAPRGRPGFKKKTQRPGNVGKPQAENQEEPVGLPPEQRLSAPPKKESVGPVSKNTKESQKNDQRSENKEKSVNTGPGEANTTHAPAGNAADQPGWERKLKEEVEDLMDEEEIVNLEMSNLDKFRAQQKMIEELNRKKKHLLASAIQKRQKQAKAEAVKLLQIQKELEKLDQLLTVDVSIIRDKIEEASREYSEAQKRYDRAEMEFITAKKHLFDTQEDKEQLTEHLYTVIQQNEIRKAKKLKELMEKLEMESTGEDNELSELMAHVEMPSLTVLNSMQAKTIHGPKSPPANARISLKSSDAQQPPHPQEIPQSSEVKHQGNQVQNKQDNVKTEASVSSEGRPESELSGKTAQDNLKGVDGKMDVEVSAGDTVASSNTSNIDNSSLTTGAEVTLNEANTCDNKVTQRTETSGVS